MKNKEIILIIVFYLLAVGQTLRFYYFPSSTLSVISQSFLPYEFIIKIIMVLIVFSVIPSFYIVMKALKERLELENTFIKLIMGFSVIPPTMALLNNYLTGDFIFSTALLVYGVIFTIVAFKFR